LLEEPPTSDTLPRLKTTTPGQPPKNPNAFMTEVSPAASVAEPVEPVDTSQRIASIDALRGFALLGILVMNIQSFSMPDAAYLNPAAYGDLTGINRLAWILSHLLTAEKMFGLFSMLFGAGILLMSDRVERRGRRPGPLHYRRMSWLILFGLLHGHLLWSGDILWFYGVSGLIVYLFRKRSPKALTASAFIFIAIGSALFMLAGYEVRSLPPDQLRGFAEENWSPTVEMIRDEISTFRGGWLGQMPLRSTEAFDMETIIFLLYLGWKTIGNMLLGMALFKWGLLTGECPRSTYRRMAVAGFLIGLPIVSVGIWKNFAAGWDVRYSMFFGSQYNYWGAIVVDIGWIGAIMLAATSPGAGWVAQRLAAVGRMAFSNYIMQTLICSVIFYGNGFGLFGSVSRVEQILIVVGIWAIQLVISPWWLRHFKYGPLEWLWRSLTYWRRMPLAMAS
jgi:uncharacterized protein